MITMEEVVICAHKSALDEMKLAKQRIGRRMERVKEEYYAMEEDLYAITEAIREKELAISAARDVFLRRCV